MMTPRKKSKNKSTCTRHKMTSNKTSAILAKKLTVWLLSNMKGPWSAEIAESYKKVEL